MANVCSRQLEYKMRHGTKENSKRDGMNKITINFGGFIRRMNVWNLQQDTFVHCNYTENIINKISNGYLKYEMSVICNLIY